MPGDRWWDSTLFRGSAAFYERGRLPYAPGFAPALAAALGLDGRGRLLDVGCGPGTVLLAMAPYVAEAVGVDPDTDMLAEARRGAERRGVANARWVAARAEDLPAGLGGFRAAVFAQSFHWTDRDRVAAAVFGMLEPGGAFVVVSDLKDGSGESVAPPEPPSPAHPAPPGAEIRALVRRYLGPVRRAGRGTLPEGTPGREDLVLARAGFEPATRHVVPGGQVVERTADSVVAWVFSRSSAAPHLFGDRLAEFERDLRALLRQASPGGRFTECLPSTEIRIWRTPAAGAAPPPAPGDRPARP
ncbi:class I SAM-dependent methyltransferase [Streptomyces sp. NPDC006012]|uniref:class I SAM-dependent methyltransferase n=1 Tax=Streptomyces sp. NPDC006012 TaxID=3364739 RepID=UPI0036A5DB50